MDSTFAVAGAKSQIISPLLTPSSGCLDLTFHYVLFGTSSTMEISVHTINTGKIWLRSNADPPERTAEFIVLEVNCACFCLCARWNSWTGSLVC